MDASTKIIIRRDQWQDLSDLLAKHPIPWLFFGDFNVIIRAHEHRGRNSSAWSLMLDFKNWTNSNNPIHLPTSGSKFNWFNKCNVPFFIERRLDRCIGNQLWFNCCNQIFVSILTKRFSDHYPLLLEFHMNPVYVVIKFKFLKTWTLRDD